MSVVYILTLLKITKLQKRRQAKERYTTNTKLLDNITEELRILRGDNSKARVNVASTLGVIQ